MINEPQGNKRADTLEKNLRSKLERTIQDEGEIAEKAAEDILFQYGAAEPEPPIHLTGTEIELRDKLRIHARQLGDPIDAVSQPNQCIRLKEEIAYEHWHRMLFARFLAENHLLMEYGTGGKAYYLSDWINRRKEDAANNVDGAEEKLKAAQDLKKKLELIRTGENPNDIFVRWKPLEKQPVGWDPDLNDGVRLNIRRFMTVPDLGKKGAGVLKDKPNIDWKKARGKDVETAPWYHLFKGDRINDHHLSLAEKQKARDR